MKKENKTISEFLESWRVKRDVSVNKVRTDLGLPLRTVQDAFNGKNLPSSYLFLKLCKYLKVTNSALTALSKKIMKES